MFNESFYPTPKHVIQKMVEPFLTRHGRGLYLQCDRIILEPSAGKGDILDYITGQDSSIRNEYLQNIYCLESEPDLQHILREKGYNVVGSDFLQYSGEHHFNLALMNPPFASGDEHLLKAWELLEEGDIACILNIETIKNPYTERRWLLRKILKDHGQVINLGAAFKNAERKTDVEIALVRLHKSVTKSRFHFDFKNLTAEHHGQLDEETARNEIATRDIVGNMMIQFQHAKDSYLEFLRATEAVSYYLQGFIGEYCNLWELLQQRNRNTNEQKYNGFCDRIRENIWMDILEKLNVEKYMTHQVRQDFLNFAKAQGMIDFTKENVQALIDFVFENRESILQRAVEEVFDLFTKYHEENRVYIEGWKTNDKWKVNRKVILPGWVTMSWEPKERLKYGANYRVNHSYQSEYSDVDKVMCYLSGTPYEDCHTIYKALDREFERIGKVYRGPATGKIESQFFKCTFYMKGTLHLEFKDEKLWQEFNMRACAGKKWLPDDDEKAWKDQRAKENGAHEKPSNLFYPKN